MDICFGGKSPLLRASIFKRLTQKLRHAFCTLFARKAELALSQSFKYESLHNLQSRDKRARNRGEKVPFECNKCASIFKRLTQKLRHAFCTLFACKAELALSQSFKHGRSNNLYSSDKRARNRGEKTPLGCLFSLFFISFSSFALDGVVFNGKLIVTENIYVCDKATGECYRACRDGDTQPGCVDSCSAETINDCVLSDRNHNGVSGSCAPGYNKGSCSYRCNNGTWNEEINTCRLYHGCSSSIYNKCARSSGSHGVSSGECIRGYTGNCSYRCDDGTWDEVSNSCGYYSCLSTAPCSKRNLPSCCNGYYNGRKCIWTGDKCVEESSSCPSITSDYCRRSKSSHGILSGRCLTDWAGTVGRCRYRCDDGSWIKISNNCTVCTVRRGGISDCHLRINEDCCVKGSCEWELRSMTCI